MARKKKDGRRATGIQGKKGHLYIVTKQPIFENGKKIYKTNWIATGLMDNDVNLPKAIALRENYINKKQLVLYDRQIFLSTYADLWLSEKQRSIADTTYSSYYYRIKVIKELLPNIKVKELNEKYVSDFLDDLFLIKKASPRTVKDTKTVFSRLIDDAVEHGIIHYNPVKNTKVNKQLSNKAEAIQTVDDDFFNYEEVNRFLELVKNHELYELFYFTVFFGLRREEVLGLRWSAVDLKSGYMKIAHTVTKGFHVNRDNTTKTEASRREYPLSQQQMSMLASIKERQKRNRNLFRNDYYDSEYVFTHQDGKLYHPDYPSKAFKKVIKRNPDLPQRITFHGLRASCVSILVHFGNDIKTIQDWVGHADVETTMKIYAKVKSRESKKTILETMSSIINPTEPK